MTVRLFSVLMIGLVCFSFISCNGNDEPNSDPSSGSEAEMRSISLTDDELSIAKQNNSFAWNMFDLAIAEDGNTIISPLSASFALCMTGNGANGTTRNEIYQALGLENYNNADINSYMQKLSSQLISLDPKATLAIANALWHNKSFRILDSYISSLRTNYCADVMQLDSSNAVNQINNWCSNKTNGYINNIINPSDITNLTAMILVNALYFNGEWKDKFDINNTYKGNFYSWDNKTSKVDFMTGEKSVEQVSAETFRMASLYFGNRSYLARFILPNKDKTFNDCINEIQTIGWDEIKKWCTTSEIKVEIPKFSLQNKLDMKPIYHQMGIETAFDSNLANFSNMTTNNCAISSAFQYNYFKIDENGATATSTSVVEIEDMADLPFILNRPFIFALTERSTGAILFLGKIEKL